MWKRLEKIEDINVGSDLAILENGSLLCEGHLISLSDGSLGLYTKDGRLLDFPDMELKVETPIGDRALTWRLGLLDEAYDVYEWVVSEVPSFNINGMEV